MRITRLYLRNYRVFEDELDLAVPDGVVGVYGPNGAGKSALMESIRWSLWGQARTPKDEIRTTGVNEPCTTEVEFEHEGHLYLVRRTITGANHTVKAEAHWNGQQVADGIRDVAAYVHSVLGMDDQSFRASVFAEQKQVAAFSSHTPQKRRDLVLRLLGITPLDKARDSARADARDARADHERLSARLPDLDELDALHLVAADVAAAAAESAREADEAVAVAAEALAAAEATFDEVDDRGRTWTGLMSDGRAAAAIVDDMTARLGALTNERDELQAAAATVEALRTEADGIDVIEQRRRALDEVAAARRAVDAVVVGDEVPAPDDDGLAAARATAQAAASALATLAGAESGATADLERARQAATRSAQLSAEEDCPMCGQALGHAFEEVQAHRAAEVAAAEQRLAAIVDQRTAAERAAKAAQRNLTAAERDHKAAVTARASWEAAAARRADAERSLAAATARLDPPPVDGEDAAIDLALAAKRNARDQLTRLQGRLERLPRVIEELAEVGRRLDEATATRDALRDKVKALRFTPAELDAAKSVRQEHRERHRDAATNAERARSAAAQATAALDTAAARLDDGRARHAEIADLADRARHLGRLSDLLTDFRNNVVATVGPRLAAQAAELFAELTDHEYDALEVDPETYELQIRDAGRLFGMDRFSGSETDLANLALRVAISEHVRFQSGGAVGLLVLDEVFGPLDEDRKSRMLLALERLRGRFRQILVVTHDNEIKEQLPSAIQVQKLPGRRATARVLAGV